MGIGDWGLGIGDWGLGMGIGPNPQSPIPNPQSPSPYGVVLKMGEFYSTIIILDNTVQKLNKTDVYKNIMNAGSSDVDNPNSNNSNLNNNNTLELYLSIEVKSELFKDNEEEIENQIDI